MAHERQVHSMHPFPVLRPRPPNGGSRGEAEEDGAHTMAPEGGGERTTEPPEGGRAQARTVLHTPSPLLPEYTRPNSSHHIPISYATKGIVQ